MRFGEPLPAMIRFRTYSGSLLHTSSSESSIDVKSDRWEARPIGELDLDTAMDVFVRILALLQHWVSAGGVVSLLRGCHIPLLASHCKHVHKCHSGRLGIAWLTPSSARLHGPHSPSHNALQSKTYLITHNQDVVSPSKGERHIRNPVHH